MNNQKITTISVHELKKRLDADPLLNLIDVREQDEWLQQRIPFAKHIPKDDVIHAIESLIPQRDDPIYLQCRSGMRSLYAANCLLNMGYQEVYSVDGGILEWANAGYPVVSGSETRES